MKTARVYINEGLAVLAELHLPKHKLRPFTQVFHSGIRLQHLSANKRKTGGRGKGSWDNFFNLFVKKEDISLELSARREALGDVRGG